MEPVQIQFDPILVFVVGLFIMAIMDLLKEIKSVVCEKKLKTPGKLVAMVVASVICSLVADKIPVQLQVFHNAIGNGIVTGLAIGNVAGLFHNAEKKLRGE